MFDFRACVFRFGNVIGGRQTHGVAYDFIKRLKSNPSELPILGDGSQSKPYIHVSDVIKALDIAFYKQSKIFDIYNVAPDSYITVTEIANIVIQQMGDNYQKCNFTYSGGKRGWKGDVPVVRMNSDKIKSLGWLASYTSKEAINLSVSELIKNAEFLFA
jgi:UDP-glucose 4-epimerase